jgi:nucleotide-binding universal stress UspA family protein
MKNTKILVPTDFSDCANNAFNYAVGLANDIGAELILMHSIIYKDTSLSNSIAKEKQNTEIFNKTKESLDVNLAYAKEKYPDLEIRTVIDAGVPELSLSSVMDSEKVDYIVMGTEGSSGVKASIFGSFTSNVLLIAPCPVFTIPASAKYRSFNNVTLATEMDDSEIKALAVAVELCKNFKSNITFYNVNSNNEAQQVILDKFKTAIEPLVESLPIQYVTKESDDILTAIEEHLCETNPDLIITLGKERSFFESLFGKKITKQLCLHTSVPLLSFPATDKK